MRKRSARFGSPEHEHVERAKKAERSMNEGLRIAKERLNKRQCAMAYRGLVQAWQGYGQVMAEDRGGGHGWISYSDFREASGQFEDICIKDLEHGLGRRNRRR